MNYKSKIRISVFKTMDTGALTTRTMAAVDKDVEWVKVQILAVSFILILLLTVDDWLILTGFWKIGLFIFYFRSNDFFFFHFGQILSMKKYTRVNSKFMACSISQSICLMIVCLLVFYSHESTNYTLNLYALFVIISYLSIHFYSCKFRNLRKVKLYRLIWHQF